MNTLYENRNIKTCYKVTISRVEYIHAWNAKQAEEMIAKTIPSAAFFDFKAKKSEPPKYKRPRND